MQVPPDVVTVHGLRYVTGPTAVGKSYVACALAQKACRDGYSAFTPARSRYSDILRWLGPTSLVAKLASNTPICQSR